LAIERSYSLRETINTNFDKVRSLADGVLFEFGPSRQQDLASRSQIREWQTATADAVPDSNYSLQISSSASRIRATQRLRNAVVQRFTRGRWIQGQANSTLKPMLLLNRNVFFRLQDLCG